MPIFDPDEYEIKKLEGWYVHQQCPACGHRRAIPLAEWNMDRHLNSYCDATGKEVYMVNLGWSQDPEPG